jgi:hypothetical protein
MIRRGIGQGAPGTALPKNMVPVNIPAPAAPPKKFQERPYAAPASARVAPSGIPSGMVDVVIVQLRGALSKFAAPDYVKVAGGEFLKSLEQWKTELAPAPKVQ